MVWTAKSTKETIALIINKLKLQDATYADDILIAIHEAMNRLRVRNRLKPTYKILKVEDFSAELPCGLVILDAVLWQHGRLRHGLGVNDTRVQPFKRFKQENLSVYFDDVDNEVYQNSLNYLALRGDQVKPVGNDSTVGDYYVPYPNHIQTTFECGEVIILYRSSPVDKEGYPLIPDEGNFHEALFSYVCGYLAFTGYKFPDPKHDFDYFDQRFEKFCRRAKSKIKFPSVDKREAVLQATVNLIPPRGYYNNFMINAESPKFINK